MISNILLSLLTGLIIGMLVMVLASKIGFNKNQRKAKEILHEAEQKADSLVKQAVLEGKTQSHEIKIQIEQEMKVRNQEIIERENGLIRREDSINFRDETLMIKEQQIETKNQELAEKMSQLDKKEKKLEEKIDEQIIEMERISSMSTAEAKKELFAIVEKRTSNEMLAYVKEKEDEAKSLANDKVRNIIAVAIQRLAPEEVLERTVSVVPLPSEEMKGRIIGREGRNIRSIEQATGVDLIVDDTPETITISCFNPIRREIARLSLERLIHDGRIQPGRIEEVVEKVKKEMDAQIMKIGEDTIFKLSIGKMDRELIYLIGTLKYRYSYGQNALQHSIEVANLSGIMAAEIGLNQQLAKRAGLLHDIGKALDIEVEGSHVELGYKVCKKHGENEVVLNGIMSHHGNEEATFLISNLIAAADAISAARPGARHESLQNYINRLEGLEKITNEFEGVEVSYAIQAGREVRVLVVPEKVDDAQTYKLARDIKEKIETELTYPGQIKVTVIREVRAGEVAK